MGPGDYVIIALAFAILAAIYITPPAIAFKRRHPQRWSITVLSLAFGGTLVGWVAALIWAIQPLEAPEHLTEMEGAENFAFQPSMSEELERLHQLLQTGAITQVEFDNLKTKLLGSA